MGAVPSPVPSPFGNQKLPGGGGEAGYPSHVYLQQDASEKDTTAMATALTFYQINSTSIDVSSVDFTVDPDHPKVTYTGAATRKFLVHWSLSHENGGSTSEQSIQLRLNGTAADNLGSLNVDYSTDTPTCASGTAVIELAEDDTLELWITDWSDTNQTITLHYASIVAVPIDALSGGAYGTVYNADATDDTTSLSATTWTKIDSTKVDGELSNVTTTADALRLTYTGTETKLFLVTCAMQCEQTGSMDIFLEVRKNGNTASDCGSANYADSSGDNTHLLAVGLFELEEDDYLEVYGYAASATTWTILNGMLSIVALGE
jgi:hypothetical protein